jgi:hypothetical protein
MLSQEEVPRLIDAAGTPFHRIFTERGNLMVVEPETSWLDAIWIYSSVSGYGVHLVTWCEATLAAGQATSFRWMTWLSGLTLSYRMECDTN